MGPRASEISSHAFNVALSREAYDHILRALKPNRPVTKPSTRRQRPITAEVELCASSSSYRFVRLQSHALPLSLELPLGTPTHSQLTRLVLGKIEGEKRLPDRGDDPEFDFQSLLRKLIRSSELINTLGAVLAPADLTTSTVREGGASLVQT